MTRRILTIIVAIVLAVIGTGAVLIYVKGADKRAMDNLKKVTILVAAHQIPAGTTAGAALSDGLLVKEDVPAKSVSGTDYVAKVTPDLKVLVFSANVPSGEVLLRPMLVTEVASASGIAIPAGDVAVTIALCVPQAVAGYVNPGSQVAIFDTVGGGGGGCSSGNSNSNNSSSNSSSSPSSKSGPTQPLSKVNTVTTRIVLTKVTVLAIGQAAPTGSTARSTAFSQSSSSNSNGTVLVTLAVDQKDAERVIYLAEDGLPYLALLGQSSKAATGPDAGTISLFPK